MPTTKSGSSSKESGSSKKTSAGSSTKSGQGNHSKIRKQRKKQIRLSDATGRPRDGLPVLLTGFKTIHHDMIAGAATLVFILAYIIQRLRLDRQ